MTVASKNELSYLGVNASNPPNVIYSTVAPTSGVGGTGNSSTPIGTMIINTSTGASYQLVSASGSSAQGTYNPTWVALGGGAAAVATVNNLSPTAGNITLAGTANQITATSAGSTVTFSLPAAVTAPGSLTATVGNITATNGNVVLGTAGNKLSIATGANASVGKSTLVGGTVTVNTTAVTANSIILLTRQSIGATGAAALGHLTVGTVTAGTSFVINAVQAADATALQATDVSVVGYMIIN